MRLPWVSRSLYEQVVEKWQDQVRSSSHFSNEWTHERELRHDATRGLLAERARADGLQEQITYLRSQIEVKDGLIAALRREGFDPPSPQPPTTHELRAKIDPAILHRIEQIAQPGTKEHFVMLQEAESLIAAYPDRPAEQIADEVTEGSPISPYRL